MSAPADIHWIAEAWKNGPFAVMVAILILIANKWEQVPKELWVGLFPLLPWLLVTVVLLGVMIWIFRNYREERTETAKFHREERADLVKSLSRGHEVVAENAAAMAQLSSTLIVLRDDLRRYRSELKGKGDPQGVWLDGDTV